MTTTATVRTARATGLAYLGLALTGMAGFLVVRPQLFTPSPNETLDNLATHPSLAATAVALEMAIVITQALAAVWFYRLLRDIRPVAAFATAAFGLVNAVAIMTSGIFMATAAAVAADPGIVEGASATAAVGLLTHLSGASWGLGALFFGLWLIPMGWAAITTDRFPAALGWVLIVGGVGYVGSALLGWGVASAPSWLVEGLAFPATVGEFWMIIYLLTVGIRAPHATPASAPATTTHVGQPS
ncbi:DUF4386 domain-containing protein [Demequina globuliformis]|uniref:DUF4386 domain-containing protein n=1 Tax=Demequina globuliformis TaxID=676202 RepID=UPI000A824881|nr:DUF4386 domain-containing protein [Demequina globuliformis]